MFGDGFIPAHAGKSVGHRSQHQDRRAHPRSRGEKLYMPRVTFQTPGSSPLTRGKHLCADAVTWDQGLIPAHAGKTWSRPCGSNARHGSSPLTRGKRRGTIRRGLCAGLIPAHAGKTVPDWEHKALPGAHPRSRGENHRRSAPNGIKSGSSPLTRGKRAKVCPRHYRLRLIPAHAGKTFSEPLRRSRAWAHPRSRVENWRVAACSSLRAGSSPLTRGKPLGDRYPQLEGELIPAHAGKTPG